MLPNHAPLMVAERFKVLGGVVSRPDRSRARPRAGHRSGHLLCVARPAGPAAGRRFPRTLSGTVAARTRRLSGRPSVPQCARGAGRRRRCRRSGCFGSSGYSAELAAAVGMGFAFAHHFADYDAASAMLSYREHFKPSATMRGALRDPGHGGDRGRYRRRGRAHRRQRRPALCPPRQRRISAARLAGRGCRLSLYAGRPRTHRPAARAARGRRRRSGQGALAGADRGDAGRRTNDHDDGLRSCGAAAFL